MSAWRANLGPYRKNQRACEDEGAENVSTLFQKFANVWGHRLLTRAALTGATTAKHRLLTRAALTGAATVRVGLKFDHGLRLEYDSLPVRTMWPRRPVLYGGGAFGLLSFNEVEPIGNFEYVGCREVRLYL